MTLAQAGSREAFAVLVERYARRVVRTCLRYSGSREQAIELAQDTWLGVWNGRDRYRPRTAFVMWLVTVARNRCRNELRRKSAEERHVRAITVLGAEPSAGQIDCLLLEERRRRVHGALVRLPPAMREALLMRYGEELGYDEMSSVLGASESTLRSRVHHGLKLLKSQLEKSQ